MFKNKEEKGGGGKGNAPPQKREFKSKYGPTAPAQGTTSGAKKNKVEAENYEQR